MSGYASHGPSYTGPASRVVVCCKLHGRTVPPSVPPVSVALCLSPTVRRHASLGQVRYVYSAQHIWRASPHGTRARAGPMPRVGWPP
eukprot:465894-Prymnesium_polylepis.1